MCTDVFLQTRFLCAEEIRILERANAAHAADLFQKRVEPVVLTFQAYLNF
jgi:hypothetical protein